MRYAPQRHLYPYDWSFALPAFLPAIRWATAVDVLSRLDNNTFTTGARWRKKHKSLLTPTFKPSRRVSPIDGWLSRGLLCLLLLVGVRLRQLAMGALPELIPLEVMVVYATLGGPKQNRSELLD